VCVCVCVCVRVHMCVHIYMNIIYAHTYMQNTHTHTHTHTQTHTHQSVMHGAGGMELIDPVFQHILAAAAKARKVWTAECFLFVECVVSICD
jgi:hypothetical protein